MKATLDDLYHCVILPVLSNGHPCYLYKLSSLLCSSELQFSLKVHQKRKHHAPWAVYLFFCTFFFVSCKTHSKCNAKVWQRWTQDMQISGEAVNATLRGNSLLRHIEEIIQARSTVWLCFSMILRMITWHFFWGLSMVIPSYGGFLYITICSTITLHQSSCLVQETGRKHLQAMQRKTVTARDRSGWVVFEQFQLNSNMWWGAQ